LLKDTGKPRKTCAELAGRRTFRILTSSQQFGIYRKNINLFKIRTWNSAAPGKKLLYWRGYALDGQGILVRFLLEVTDFCLLQIIQTVSGAHPDSYGMVPGAVFRV
jgi:hypothetical protein